jgi:hypothetical protein
MDIQPISSNDFGQGRVRFDNSEERYQFESHAPYLRSRENLRWHLAVTGLNGYGKKWPQEAVVRHSVIDHVASKIAKEGLIPNPELNIVRDGILAATSNYFKKRANDLVHQMKQGESSRSTL